MRLFFGISLPDCVNSAAAGCAHAAAQQIPGRYTLPDNYHITLAFLGEVPPERLPDAQAALDRCIRTYPAPRLTLGAMDYFASAQRGILILRVVSDPPLDALHQRLVDALARCSLPFDPGPFSPHITLARRAVIPEGALPPVPALSFTAQQAHVYISARDNGNILRYTPAASCSFAPAAP